MAIGGIVGMLLLFLVIGAVLLVQAMAMERRRNAASAAGGVRERLTARDVVRRYVGPVTPDLALLNPPARVAIEFVGALCGFPGFGWMTSTRVWIGLPLLIAGPAIVFGFYPLYLVSSGHIADRPLIALEYLPFLAVASASALAVAEMRHARSGHEAQN
jgi:hypothetical protein